MARRWTRREDVVLARFYRDGVAVREIAETLRRSEDAVNARRRCLAVPARRARSWTAREDALLVGATRSGLSAAVVAELLGRGVGEVRWRRRALGLLRPGARPYTGQEDAALRAALREGTDLGQLAQRLRRSASGLRLRAAKLGLHRPTPRRRWSASEDAAIRDGYDSGLRCEEIARELLGRTPDAVAARARRLGLATHARRWTAAEDNRLRRLAPRRSIQELAVLLGRTPDALRQRAHKLQVALLENATPPRSGAPWTVADDELLHLHAGLNPAALARLLGRSDRAITIRLVKLGLRSRRERSPHHRTPRLGGLTPGEQAVLERELSGRNPRRVLMIARRLELPSSALAMSTTDRGGRRRPTSARTEATAGREPAK
jgi:hypothetical protein